VSPQPGPLAGRVALITGGGTGLGLEIARRFSAAGARCVLTSRNAERLESAAAGIRGAGGDAIALPADVRDYRAVRRAVAETVERFGGLDILVNNAAGNFVRPSEALPEAAFANVVDIVLNGTFYASRAAGRVMLRAGKGVVLNIVATYAWHGGPGTVHSAAAKAGVLAMTRTLAVEWALRGVRVVAIAPGPFDSTGAGDRLWPSDELREAVRRTIPLGRFARRDEVARACLWLVSDEAAFVTGECLTIDGGAWLGRGILGEGEAIPVVKRRRGGDSGAESDAG